MWFFLSDIYHSYGSFEFIKVSIIGTFDYCWKIGFLEIQYVRTNAEDQFLEEIQAAKIFSKVSLYFNKMPNSLRQVLQTHLETCFL